QFVAGMGNIRAVIPFPRTPGSAEFSPWRTGSQPWEKKIVPLLDHFHPPLSERRPWESFHSTWASTLADVLNRDLLPPGYIAREHIHAGAVVEIDVSSYGELPAAPGEHGGTATATRPVWTPAA